MTHTCTCTQNSYMVIITRICGKWQQRPTEQLSVFRTIYIIALLEIFKAHYTVFGFI